MDNSEFENVSRIRQTNRFQLTYSLTVTKYYVVFRLNTFTHDIFHEML